ncbi:MAG: hypothetical protein EOL87_06155 [Spartobacteria bacterium]|nr:hypothetical protein [Spartobacteria bacterium]
MLQRILCYSNGVLVQHPEFAYPPMDKTKNSASAHVALLTGYASAHLLALRMSPHKFVKRGLIRIDTRAECLSRKKNVEV